MEPEENTDSSIEDRIVSKLQNVIKTKKKLSEKQQAHLDKLAKAKAGKKYQVIPEPKVEEVKEPVKKKKVVKVKEPTSDSESEVEPEVVIVKKKKVIKKKPKIIYQSESESESEPEVIVKKKPKPKAKPKPKEEVVYQRKSYFNVDIL